MLDDDERSGFRSRRLGSEDNVGPAGVDIKDCKAGGMKSTKGWRPETSRNKEDVGSAPATTPIMIKATNEKTLTKATNENTPKTKERKMYREALLGQEITEL